MLATIDSPILLGLLFVVIPFAILPIRFSWIAFYRAGLPAPLAVLNLIPFGIVIVLAILAFAERPNLPRRKQGS